VAGAGDVNGDGYADVIVGARFYDAGQNDEGAAFVFLGSASGIASGNPSTANAQLESDQLSAELGVSVAGPGDVDGDGFADVIVGSSLYDAGELDEGAAFVFYGGGGANGRPVRPLQIRGGFGAKPVQPWGASEDADDFVVDMIPTHPQGRGSVAIEIEACSVPIPFGDPSCTSAITSWSQDVPVSLANWVSPLTVSTLYRWRARVLHAPFTVTKTGITPPPNPAHGPWRRYLGQAFEADIRTGLAGDTDVDGLANQDEVDVHSTDPQNPDSDDDGALDGDEVALGIDPNLPDHDGDGVCDGSGTGGGACTAGPDNCPFLDNPLQTNSDGLAAGDECQCGDVNTDFVVDAADIELVREHLMDRSPAPFDAARCNVIGPQDAGASDCGVNDVKVLRRALLGDPLPNAAGNACAAYFGP
jgi:hypothetical protein